jgi:hypothetical protein
MKKIVPLFLLLFAYSLVSPSIRAESADKIIDRFKKASGDKAVKRIKSTMMIGTVKTEDGKTGHFQLRTESPDRIRLDIEADDIKISECFNGKSAWRQDIKGVYTLLGPDSKMMRLYGLISNSRLRDLSRYKIFVRSDGKGRVGDRDADVIDLSQADIHTRLFFDPSSRLVVKLEHEAAGSIEEIFYDDYRSINGVMEPFSIKIKNGSGLLAVNIEKVEHNIRFDETAFSYPRVEGASPLPDVELLLKTVVSNQEKVQELRGYYTFREDQTELELDSKGNVKKTETRIYDVTPVDGDFVRRLISLNGKELSPSEREKEDRRVKKEIEEIKRDREERIKKKRRSEAKGNKSKNDDEDDDQITILSFLRVSNVTSVRREPFRGHEVVAFDFEPRKGYKPKNRLESIISKLGGTFFVDEKASQIVRLEARFLDSFKLLGGLASVAPSSAIVIEQQKVRDEVWFPSYVDVNISAKALFIMKVNNHVTSRFSDYKKYQTDVELKFEDKEN